MSIGTLLKHMKPTTLAQMYADICQEVITTETGKYARAIREELTSVVGSDTALDMIEAAIDAS